MTIKIRGILILASFCLGNVASGMEEQKDCSSNYEQKSWYNVVDVNASQNNWEQFVRDSVTHCTNLQNEREKVRNNINEVKKLEEKWLEEHLKRNKEFMNK